MSKKKGNELIDALKEIEVSKGISQQIMIEAIEAALESAYQKNFNKAQNVRIDFDQTTGDFRVFARKVVKEEVESEHLEISLSRAQEINPNFVLEDVVEEEVTPKDFGRVAASNAKQVVLQRLREAERSIVYNEFIDKQDDIITGTIQRRDLKNCYVTIGRTEAILPMNEMVPTEEYEVNARIKAYITKVDKTTKGPQIIISRKNPGLLKRLFELEVPEIFDGVVEIRSVAREAGDRAKISVHSNNPDVDPIGACVGENGERVGRVVEELSGEKIDIVVWSENPVDFVASALSPADVFEVHVNEEERSTVVIVPDNQISLAIGKRGQNARLAAKLTGWKIDIKSESDARAQGLIAEYYEEDGFYDNNNEEF